MTGEGNVVILREKSVDNHTCKTKRLHTRQRGKYFAACLGVPHYRAETMVSCWLYKEDLPHIERHKKSSYFVLR